MGKTRASYARVLYRWLSLCIQAGTHILEVSTYMIEGFVRAEQARGLSKRSINGELTPIVGFYQWAHRHGYIGSDPGALVRRPSNPRRSNLKWLSRDKLTAFLAAALEHDETAHILACLHALSGLRVTESLQADTRHLEDATGTRVLFLPHRKFGQADRVALPTYTLTHLDQMPWIDKPGRIARKGGKPLTQSQVYGLYDHVSKAASIGFAVRPHMLRATFVTLSLEAGVPVRDVMNSAGHSSYSMVAYYDRAYGQVKQGSAQPLVDWLGLPRTQK